MQRVTPATPIGWIGTGVMGSHMCGHLMRRGHPMTVYNRTRSKAESLLAAGAEWAESPKAVAARCPIVFSIVGFPEDVREIALDDGVLAGWKAAGCKDGILVDMTTSQPKLAVEIANQAAEIGAASIDAPVSGGDVGAKNASLSIMIGGADEPVEAIMPCFQAMGKTIVHQGGPGAGQHTKMVNQTLIATNMIGVCEALLYAHQAGLDLEKVMQSVASGAAGSWSLSNLGPRIIQGDFRPGFYVEHFLKDMRIALEEARMRNLDLPGLELAESLYRDVQQMSHGRSGTQALQLALAKRSDIVWDS